MRFSRVFILLFFFKELFLHITYLVNRDEPRIIFVFGMNHFFFHELKMLLLSTFKVKKVFNFSISTCRQLVRYIHYMPSPYGQNNNIIDALKQDNITNIDYQHPHNSQLKLEHIKRKRLIRFAWDFQLGIF